MVHIRAQHDERLSARVIGRKSLHYAEGDDAALDRPAHVRAASGVAWAGDRLVIVQDDANFLALVDPRDASVEALTLPAGVAGRRQFDDGIGNKAHKFDLEAVVAIPGEPEGPLIVAFGSGATSRRETVLLARGIAPRQVLHRGPSFSLHALPGFYKTLRATTAFAGSELNIEGVVLIGRDETSVLRFFNRGNGAQRDGVVPVNASCDVGWPALRAHLQHPESCEPPMPGRVVQYDLGVIDGIALGFTDAVLVPARREASAAILYVAAAEDSPDAVRDGPVAGGAIGVIEERSGGVTARWAELQDEAGGRFDGKVEGIALHRGDSQQVWVVVDRDIPGAASELCEVVLEGPWLE